MNASPEEGARHEARQAAETHTLLPRVDPTEAQVKVVSEAESYLTRARKRLTRHGRDGGLVRACRSCDRGGGAMKTFRRILHATDFSSASRPAFARARRAGVRATALLLDGARPMSRSPGLPGARART